MSEALLSPYIDDSASKSSADIYDTSFNISIKYQEYSSTVSKNINFDRPPYIVMIIGDFGNTMYSHSFAVLNSKNKTVDFRLDYQQVKIQLSWNNQSQLKIQITATTELSSSHNTFYYASIISFY